MILITGGAGYIGSVLVHKLLANKNGPIRVLDNFMYTAESLMPISKNIELVRGDIRDADICIYAMKDVGFVIHLAAIVGENACAKNPTLAKDTNLYATRQLWEIANEHNVNSFAFASTCSNYGKASMATEESELFPLGLYAETKVAAEKWLLEQNGMHTMIFRFATAFGISPRMRWDLLINQFILEAYTNKKLSLYNPNAMRPYCHVEDIGMAIRSIYQSKITNVGGYNRTKLQLASYISHYIPDIEIEIVDKGDDRDYSVDFSRLHNLGIVPKMTPEKGIDELFCALPLFDDLSDRKWVNS